MHLARDLEKKESRFKYYSNNTYIALKYFKNNGIDILIIVGDISHNGKLINFLYFNKIFNAIYKGNYKTKSYIIYGKS